jgi:hypothetical protein
MYAYNARKPRTGLKRPPSYSDSFVFQDLPSSSDPLSLNGAGSSALSLTLLAPQPIELPDPGGALHPVPSTGQFSTFSIPAGFSTTEKWTTRFLGFGVHLTLVSVFETLFFFLFISKSEDTGLTNVLDGYVNGVLTTCHTWPANTTIVINDILSVLINATQVAQAATQAAATRQEFNHTLEVQAWCYVAGLIGVVILGTTGAHLRGFRIAWRRIILENLIMVSLLGLYELTFFKTIIYRYENMSLPELDGFVVNQLQSQCGLLSSQ